MIRKPPAAIAFPAVLVAPQAAQAAAALDGATMSHWWDLPFLGLLMTIATGPLLFPKFWHAHYGKLAIAWSVAILAALAAVHGLSAAFATFPVRQVAKGLTACRAPAAFLSATGR